MLAPPVQRSTPWRPPGLPPTHSTGAEGGIRTHTSFSSAVFETAASAIPPLRPGFHDTWCVLGNENAHRLAGVSRGGDWSGRRGSNSRPPPWQGGALPLSYFRPRFEYSNGHGHGQMRPSHSRLAGAPARIPGVGKPAASAVRRASNTRRTSRHPGDGRTMKTSVAVTPGHGGP